MKGYSIRTTNVGTGMVFMIKLASDLLQVGSCHGKVGQ